MSLRDLHPTRISALFSSSSNILTSFVTPGSPNTRLYATGRATKTQLAPRARHLKISLPVLTPPSMKMGILSPTAPFILGRMLMVELTPSSCLPPWFETHIPSQQSIAIDASLGCIIPLSTILSLVMLLIFLMVSQVNDRSRLAKNLLFSLYSFFSLLEVELAMISSRMGKVRLEVSIGYLASLFLTPSTCASTVIAKPVNPCFYAKRIWLSVRAQSLETYICINLKPPSLLAATSEKDLLAKMLSEQII